MLILFKQVRLKSFSNTVRREVKNRVWVYIFRIAMVLKILALRGFQFILAFSTSLQAMNFYRNLTLTKVALLSLNFLSLSNLAFYYMSQTSKEIISFQKLCCFFEVLFLLRILLWTLDMVVLGESSLGLSFYKNF